MNLPDSNFLPAPIWLITSLHVLTLSLHFAAMNFVLGGVLFVLTGNSDRRRDNPAVRRFIVFFPSVMAATVTLGVAPLLFLQLAYPLQMYPASIVSAWFFLLIVPVVILVYYLLYAAAFSVKGGKPARGRCLWPAILGLLYVSLVYSSVFSMAEHPDLIRRLYSQDQGGFQWNPAAGDYALRWLHMVLGALTVGGFFAGVLGAEDAEVFSAGKKTFAYGMAAAGAAGLAYLLSLGDLLGPLMRSGTIWILTAGIVLSLGSLHLYFKRRFLFAGVALFSSLLLMVITRHELRLLRLQGSFDPASWRVAPQWAAFLIFLVSFAVAAVLVVYMLRLFFSFSGSDPENAI
jgi:hypothetical protein